MKLLCTICGETSMNKFKFNITKWKEKLKNGADINQPDKSGRTALEQAILANNIEGVDFCIAHGADVNLNNTPMFLAADNSKKPEIIELLVKAGADIEANCQNEMTPLMSAVLGFHKDNYAVIKKMIELGADVNAKDEKGFSILFTSLAVVAKDNQEKIKLLIQSGADVNATDNNNETPLFWANWCDADVIKAFVGAGADVNAKNKQGRTPLFYAVRCCKNPNTIKALMEFGADVSVCDNCGKTALDYTPNESVARKILAQYKPH